MRGRTLHEATRELPPGVPRRGCETIGFRGLTTPHSIRILDLEIAKVIERLKGKNLKLNLDEQAKDFLVEKGYDPTYGARPMRRTVERFLEDPLAEEILNGNLHEGEPVQVTVENGKLLFSQASPAAGTGALSS